MNETAPPPRRSARRYRSIVGSRVTLWVAFILVHLWLGFVNLYSPSYPIGDVSFVYKLWTDQAIVAHYRVGIDTVWVYPIVALLPMLAAIAFGPGLYASTWLAMVMLIDVVAFAALTGWWRTRRHTAIGWWWIAFLLLVGPIALGRIDSITVPVAIVGVLLLARRPRAAAVVLTIATWIKVWPAALLAAIAVAGRDRRTVVIAGAVTSAVIVGIALALGSGGNVFSFITQQASRGLQVEAPVSVIWLWLAAMGVPGAYVYYDQPILTYQVTGPGADAASTAMTPLLAAVALAVCALGVLAVRRAGATAVLPVLALALVAALIAVNKVGSPQFYTWLVVPVILGLVMAEAGLSRSFRTPAIIVLVLAALTQVVYPYLYAWLLVLNPLMLIAITARHVLLLGLLGWALDALRRLAWPGDRDIHGTLEVTRPRHC